MVDDEAILERRRAAPRRPAQARRKALVEAANRGGGEDNITVVLLRGRDGARRTRRRCRRSRSRDRPGADDEDTLSGLDGARASREDVGAEQLDEWLELDGTRRRRRRRRAAAAPGRGRHPVVLALTVLARARGAVFALALWGLVQRHFVGASARTATSRSTRACPFDLGGGVHLYREVYVSPLYAAQLTQPERQQLFAHDLRSYDAAPGRAPPVRARRPTREPPQPRAAEPDRRRDADRDRVRERLHRAPVGRLDRVALLRGLLLRALPRRAPRRADHRAVRRPVPAADGRRC